MFFTTSQSNFEQYSNQYNANQTGLDSGYLMKSDLEAEMITAGFEEVENHGIKGAESVWKKEESGDDLTVVFEFETGEEDAIFAEIAANLKK